MNTQQKPVQLVYFLIIFLSLKSLRADFANSTEVNDVKIRCLDRERKALLKFKDELIDEYGDVLSSWGTTQECCKWGGVTCSNHTHHIVGLTLSDLKGKISPWLLELQYLNHLELKGNDFNGSKIPSFIGSLSRLRYLDLSSSGFGRSVPQHLGNLSRLQFLALSNNPMSNISNLSWLSKLQSLTYVDLSSLNLKEATNWFHAITNLPQLKELHLSSCQLQSPPSASISVFKNASNSVSKIDLTNNELSSTSLFFWMLNSSSSLTDIELCFNNLQGPIPTSFWNMNNLVNLGLCLNLLCGFIPQSMGNLSKLENLSLNENQFQGVITEAHFFSLSKLQTFDMMHNPQISFAFSSGWVPPFQLSMLVLDDCKVGPYFPTWLRTQKELHLLSMANTGIRDVIPHWFWDISSNLYFFNVSHNHIHGVLPSLSSVFPPFYAIDLSYNDFNSSLPTLPTGGGGLILSNNRFSGPLTVSCSEPNWVHLDLSNNLLSGEFPFCLANSDGLQYLNLAHNNFSGKVPSLNTSWFSCLYLQNNSFTGEILTSFKNSRFLQFIDLSENKFTGEIPIWLGDRLPELFFLSLRSNLFFGNIPSTICHLAYLQVLDISLNMISGVIPKCLNNLTAMHHDIQNFGFRYQVGVTIGFLSANITWKGQEQEYSRTLNLVKFVDLSSNNLQGEIPQEITSLERLVGLNLSRNNLTGFLPPMIGKLTSLNFLDLSRNHLSGEIPAGLSNLHQLGLLDLSYNNLSGRIPWNDHLETFNNSSYVGNVALCGPPLMKPCPGEETDQHPKFSNGNCSDTTNQEEDRLITEGWYISMAVGFSFGFWGVIGTLVLNHSLRYAFFKFWSSIIDWLFIKIAKIC